MPAPISVAGGPGNDEITTGLADDVLAGGPDNDILDGGAGIDDYFGETGDDVIRARDGRAERISCGADTDEANNDFVDIIAECERGIDGDADGFSSAVDCNDAVASISPGAAEVFDNGVDENCDGRDNPNLDRDADGFPQPGDCNDANAAVRPNVPEIRGNAVDENCDRRADPFAQLGAVVSNQWAIARRYTRLLSLVVRNAPQGARVTLTCNGRDCPVKRRRRTVSRNLQRDRAPQRLPQAAPAPGDAAAAHDHRGGDDRAHVHVRRQARRAADADDRLPRTGRGEGPVMLKRRLLVALAATVAAAALAPATAAAGVFTINGSTIVYDGDAGVDQITGYDTGDTIRFTRFGGDALGGGLPCLVSPDQQSVDCPEGGSHPCSSTSTRVMTSPP